MQLTRIFQTGYVILFAATLVLDGCKKQEKTDVPHVGCRYFEARPDTIPIPYAAETLRAEPRRAIFKEVVVSREKNVFPMPAPRKIKATVPKKTTPGKDGFSLPVAIPIVEKKVLTGSPEVVEFSNAQINSSITHNFNYFSKQQGLSHDDVYCFTEDKQGRIWIGTNGGGLGRYDGKYLATFGKKNGLKSSGISSLLADSKGNVWVGTREAGLYRFDGVYTTEFSVENGLLGNTIASIVEDKRGNIWVSYWDSGISCITEERILNFTKAQGLAGVQVADLGVDENGHLWIASGGEGIVKYDGESFFQYTLPSEIKDAQVYVFKIQDNKVWMVLHYIGLLLLESDNYYLYLNSNDLPLQLVNDITSGRNGEIWMGTWGEGLLLFDGQKCTKYSLQQGLQNGYIHRLYNDSKGILWIGHWYGGMSTFLGNTFEHIIPPRPFNQSITSVAYADEKLWMSSQNGGLMSYDGQKFIHYIKQPKSEEEDFALWVMADSKEHLWFSVSGGGLIHFDGKEFFEYHLNPQMEGSLHIINIMEASNGDLWMVVNRSSIMKFNGEFFTVVLKDDGLLKGEVNYLFEDSNGRIWISTWGGGLYCLDNNTFLSFNTGNGMGSNFFYSVYEDRFGNIWAGAEGMGLYVYDGKGFLNLSTREGLIDDISLSLIEDTLGNMIVGGRFGVSILPPSSLEKIAECLASDDKTSFGELSGSMFIRRTVSDGFFGVGCNRAAITKAPDGRVIIGANDRVTAFNSAEMVRDTIPPVVVLSSMLLFNEEVNWSHFQDKPDAAVLLSNGVMVKNLQFDSVFGKHGLPEGLKLAHNNNYLTFAFVGITTLAPDKVQYSFMLDGYEQNWQRVTSENYAHYGNLSPGTYTFRLRSINSQGFWSEPLEYSFTIKKPWWHTWWAYFAYFLLAFTSFAYFVKYRESALILQNKLLDKEVEVARKTIEFKQNFLANISHEIRTPLSGVLGMSDILNKSNLDANQKSYLNALKQSGENLREIINQILDYNKIEAGTVELKLEEFALMSLFEHAEKLFSTLNEKPELRFEYFIAADVPVLIEADKGRVDRIIQNLLSNAIKFTSQGLIRLSVERILNQDTGVLPEGYCMLCIKVEDTGVGMDDAFVKSVFEPFSQAEKQDNRKADSVGLGLVITKNLAEMLGGSIHVQSKPGEGSVFSVTFRAKILSSIATGENSAEESLHQLPPLKVLYVEDKKVNQTVMKLMLESAGHKVDIAANGQIALDMFRPELFDVILMDIQMPVMDGVTATRILKETYPDAPPIIGISANAFKGDRERYMGIGMDEYLTKPVDEEDLNRVLRRFFV